MEHQNDKCKARNSKRNEYYSDISMRRATYSDIPAIKNLRNCETDFYFGPSNKIEELIEIQLYAKVLLNKSKDILAFACLDSVPHVPALDESCWDIWLKKHFNVCEFQGVLFIRYLVFDSQLNSEMLKILIHEIFLTFRSITFIVLLEPPMNDNQNESFYLYRNMIKYWSPPHFSHIVPPDIPHLKIYLLYPDSFLFSVKCRIATAEDNDILVDILNKKYPSLKKRLGEFHVAEQILKNDPNKTYILMEKDDEVFGVMLINKIVDFDFLNKHFDLALTNYLKRVDDNAKKNMMIAKDVILRKTSDFFDSNYFKLKPRLFESRHQPGQNEENSEIESDNSVSKGVNETLLSLSFDLDPSTSDSSNSNLLSDTSEQENIQPFCSFAGKDLMDNNPNLIFAEREVLIPEGKSNAFLIELFASNIDERRMYELLKASFSLCNDKDFCITLVKPEQSQQFLLNYFTYSPKRIESECDLGLYIAHRNTVLRSIHAIEASIDDIPEIEIFLKINDPKRCSECGEIYKTFIESVTSYRYDYKSIVIRTNHSVIGLIIIQTENNLYKLRKYFALDTYFKYETIWHPELHGRIIYLLLLPLFNNAYRILFRLLYTITGYKFLYYALEDIENIKIYNNLIGKMCSVMPNIVYDIFEENSFKNRTYEPHDALKKEPAYPLFYQSIKLNEHFFQNIGTHILCVGFDDTCKGFLKKLLFDRKYTYRVFENITVITQAGDYECQTTQIYNWVYKLLNVRNYNSPDYLKRMGLRIWVNFVSGKITAIDRKSKIVYLRGYKKLKYDYLILTCSINFGFPGVSKWSYVAQPSNYEVINNTMEAALFVHKLKILMQAFPKGFNIIVYGNALHSYACINFLLEKGISGENIHFVILEQQDSDETNVAAFRDKSVENCILKEIEKSHVNIYNGYRFVGWICEENSHMITKVTFRTKFKVITIKCRMFVCYNGRSLKRIYRSIFQRSGLLIDGRLVIDENYKLNDPYIFAAGPITQYKRLLFANKYDHYYFDPFEVGESLCDKFFENHFNYPQEKRIDRIPKFNTPKVQQAFLPGGYLYISIVKSGQILPIQISKLFQAKLGHNKMWQNFNADKKETDNQNWRCEFFRLRYYDDGTFRTMICLTKKIDTSLDFLAEFFQHNIKLLDTTHERLKNGFSMDPLTYFTKTWCSAILYPRFKECNDENMNIMINYLLNNPSTKNIIRPYLKERRKLTLSENEKKSIINSLRTENVIRKLEFNLIKFINQNSNHLFMYIKCNTDLPYFLKYLQERNIYFEDE